MICPAKDDDGHRPNHNTLPPHSNAAAIASLPYSSIYLMDIFIVLSHYLIIAGIVTQEPHQIVCHHYWWSIPRSSHHQTKCLGRRPKVSDST